VKINGAAFRVINRNGKKMIQVYDHGKYH
jgi:hypothetical protein